LLIQSDRLSARMTLLMPDVAWPAWVAGEP
jgi:hypothetical protein